MFALVFFARRQRFFPVGRRTTDMNTIRLAALALVALTFTAATASAVIDPGLDVPEPGSLALLVSAFGAAAVALRRRRS